MSFGRKEVGAGLAIAGIITLMAKGKPVNWDPDFGTRVRWPDATGEGSGVNIPPAGVNPDWDKVRVTDLPPLPKPDAPAEFASSVDAVTVVALALVVVGVVLAVLPSGRHREAHA